MMATESCTPRLATASSSVQRARRQTAFAECRVWDPTASLGPRRSPPIPSDVCVRACVLARLSCPVLDLFRRYDVVLDSVPLQERLQGVPGQSDEREQPTGGDRRADGSAGPARAGPVGTQRWIDFHAMPCLQSVPAKQCYDAMLPVATFARCLGAQSTWLTSVFVSSPTDCLAPCLCPALLCSALWPGPGAPLGRSPRPRRRAPDWRLAQGING